MEARRNTVGNVKTKRFKTELESTKEFSEKIAESDLRA